MKSTDAILTLRIEAVSKLLIEGRSREYIVQYSSDNWTIGERMTDKYIQRARTLIEESVSKNVKYDYAKALRRFESLFEASNLKGDYRTAMSINKEIATLQGLYKTQIEHSGNIEFISNIPD